MLFQWSDESVAFLREIHAQGGSASTISKLMNERYGAKLTRSAIIGKIYRIGLALSHNKPVRKEKPLKQARVPAAPKPPKPKAEARPPKVKMDLVNLSWTPPVYGRVPFMKRRMDYHCAALIGQGMHSDVCGQKIVRGSYCEEHAARFYVDGSAARDMKARARKAANLAALNGTQKVEDAEDEPADLVEAIDSIELDDTLDAEAL